MSKLRLCMTKKAGRFMRETGMHHDELYYTISMREQEIEELETQLSTLRHDIARHVSTCGELATELSELKTKMAASESAAIAIHGLLYSIGGPLNDNREQYSHEQLRIFFRIKNELDALEGL